MSAIADITSEVAVEVKAVSTRVLTRDSGLGVAPGNAGTRDSEESRTKSFISLASRTQKHRIAYQSVIQCTEYYEPSRLYKLELHRSCLKFMLS